ncbi:hypothetical protein BU17DRAFT_82199 [Hysterangium stoloniferum]|nr:hypothetical protein BU17DRAFT_82199 [Hysterangium stoloniferum]
MLPNISQLQPEFNRSKVCESYAKVIEKCISAFCPGLRPLKRDNNRPLTHLIGHILFWTSSNAQLLQAGINRVVITMIFLLFTLNMRGSNLRVYNSEELFIGMYRITLNRLKIGSTPGSEWTVITGNYAFEDILDLEGDILMRLGMCSPPLAGQFCRELHQALKQDTLPRFLEATRSRFDEYGRICDRFFFDVFPRMFRGAGIYRPNLPNFVRYVVYSAHSGNGEAVVGQTLYLLNYLRHAYPPTHPLLFSRDSAHDLFLVAYATAYAMLHPFKYQKVPWKTMAGGTYLVPRLILLENELRAVMPRYTSLRHEQVSSFWKDVCRRYSPLGPVPVSLSQHETFDEAFEFTPYEMGVSATTGAFADRGRISYRFFFDLSPDLARARGVYNHTFEEFVQIVSCRVHPNGEEGIFVRVLYLLNWLHATRHPLLTTIDSAHELFLCAYGLIADILFPHISSFIPWEFVAPSSNMKAQFHNWKAVIRNQRFLPPTYVQDIPHLVLFRFRLV